MKLNKHQAYRLNILPLLLSILLMAVSCESADRKQLRQRVETTDAKCPISGNGFTIDSVKYTDNVVTYYAHLSSNIINLEVLRDKQDLIKPALAQMVAESDSRSIHNDLELCARAGATIRFALTKGDDTLDVDIDPKQITKSEELKTKN